MVNVSYDFDKVIPEKIKNLNEGKIFKNFKALSEFFNVLDKNGKPLGGSSKVRFIAELKRYVEIERDGNCYKVVKIRSNENVLPSRQKGGNYVYCYNIQNIVRYHLIKLLNESSDCERFDILWSNNSIIKDCGMVNSNFFNYHVNCKEYKNYMSFRQHVKEILKSYIKVALNLMLQNHEFDFCKYESILVNTCPDGDRMRTLTSEEKSVYDSIRTNILHNYKNSSGKQCENEKDVFLLRKLSEYYYELDKETTKALSCDHIYSMYHFTISRNELDRMKQLLDKIDVSNEIHNLNNNIVKSLLKQATIKRSFMVREQDIEYSDSGYILKTNYYLRDDSDELMKRFISETIEISDTYNIPKSNYCVVSNIT